MIFELKLYLNRIVVSMTMEVVARAIQFSIFLITQLFAVKPMSSRECLSSCDKHLWHLQPKLFSIQLISID